MSDLQTTVEAIERLENLRTQRVVYISDGSSGGDKVGQALAAFRVIVPALEVLLRAHAARLQTCEALGKGDLIDHDMDNLVEAILTVPAVMSPDRLQHLLARISDVG